MNFIHQREGPISGNGLSQMNTNEGCSPPITNTELAISLPSCHTSKVQRVMVHRARGFCQPVISWLLTAPGLWGGEVNLQIAGALIKNVQLFCQLIEACVAFYTKFGHFAADLIMKPAWSTPVSWALVSQHTSKCVVKVSIRRRYLDSSRAAADPTKPAPIIKTSNIG